MAVFYLDHHMPQMELIASTAWLEAE